MEDKTKKGLIIGGSILAVVLIAGSVTLGLVLGGSKTKEALNGVHEMTFYSNMPDYKSSGFNLAPHDGAVDYQDYLQSDDYEGKTDTNVGMIHSSVYDDTGEKYVSDVKGAYAKGARAILTAGYQVANTFMGSDYADYTYANYEGYWGEADDNGVVEGHEDEYFAILDDTLIGTTYKNGVSVNYLAEGAGYLASYPAAVYTIWNSNEKDLDRNIVMWGGYNYDTVYNFMSGFAQGITEINKKLENKIVLWNGGVEAGDSFSNTEFVYDGKDNSAGAGFVDGSTWYTHGFNAGGEEIDVEAASLKTSNAKASGASVVFPVAGGNTQVALEGLAGNTTGTKLLGVDTDNTIDYDQYADLIIGSATKDLQSSAKMAMWAIDDYDGDGELNGFDPVDSDPLAEEGKQFQADWVYTPKDDEPAPVGQVYEGTMSNGGVGFTFVNSNNGEGKEGVNTDLVTAFVELFDDVENEDDVIEKINTVFEAHLGDTISGKDAEFEFDYPKEEE